MQANSDIGWVVGHSFIVYGPLLVGAASVFYEGQRYKSKTLVVAPTALRVIKKMDFDGYFLKQSDLSTLKHMCILGERCDPNTLRWIHNLLPNVIMNDNWW